MKEKLPSLQLNLNKYSLMSVLMSPTQQEVTQQFRPHVHQPGGSGTRCFTEQITESDDDRRRFTVIVFIDKKHQVSPKMPFIV